MKDEEKKKFEFSFIAVFFILTGIGLLIALASAILFFVGNDIAGAVGIISTIVSIVLSAISMAYTYISGVQTLKTIQDLKNQNNRLVKKINRENSKDNYNETSADKAFNK